MSVYSIFRLKNHALMMALASAYPVLSYSAGSAQVDFATGNVTAVSSAGAQRPLTKGAEISAGDTIRTGEGGRAQVRFSDGALISLQPATEFRIDNYQFANKGDSEEKGFFSLLKGGMRTITGLIGRSNRDNYKVTTSVATIGIRGTEYTAGLDPSGNQLLVHTGEGLVEVCNGAGCVLLGAGESGSVPGRGARPQRTESRPQLPPAQPDTSVLPPFSVGDIAAGLYIPTSPMPVSGSATYSTIVSQQAGASAQLTSASIGVNFGTYAVTTSLSGNATVSSFTQPFTVTGSGTVSGNTLSSSLSGFGAGFCATSCSGSLSGTFYGTGAERVGIKYSITEFGGPNTVTGGAVISK